jgi:hypothetical protein
MSNPLYTKTWLRSPRGLDLRCYMHLRQAKHILDAAVAASEEIKALTGIFPNPQELPLESNAHGVFLRYSVPSGTFEESLATSLGWKRGQDLF